MRTLAPFGDDLFDDEPVKNTFLLKSMRLTTSDGQQISIPKYDQFPKYFDRPARFDVKWVEPPPALEFSKAKPTQISLAEKYIPKTYSDLISDEKSNRAVLEWFKHFEKSAHHQKTMGKGKRKSKSAEPETPEDEEAVKISHILIVSGAPGSGKSTLVNVIAAHCGFHTVELSASDDMTNERNHLLIQNQLDFEPVFGAKTKPVLLLEGADGSVHESVLKAITDMRDRPVVIIVNDAYCQSLRALRQMSTIVKLPPPTSQKFIYRLHKVCEREEIDASNQALVEIAETSHFDMRTSLNSLQFLAIHQPITPEMVHLMPVGTKNCMMTPFDVWTSLFTATTKPLEALEILETYGDPFLISSGILENIEQVKATDPTKQRLSDLLDNLCFADIASSSDLSSIGLAFTPMLYGTVKSSLRYLRFPTVSFSKESLQRGNEKLIHQMPVLRQYIDLAWGYLNPSQETVASMSSKTSPIRERFTEFHRKIGLTYKKGMFGAYSSIPNVDSLVGMGSDSLAKQGHFREMMGIELESQSKQVRELASSTRISDKLQNSQVKKRRPITDFWGQAIESTQTQNTQITKASLFYKYNEGFTKAVKRKVPLSRLLSPECQ